MSKTRAYRKNNFDGYLSRNAYKSQIKKSNIFNLKVINTGSNTLSHTSFIGLKPLIEKVVFNVCPHEFVVAAPDDFLFHKFRLPFTFICSAVFLYDFHNFSADEQAHMHLK